MSLLDDPGVLAGLAGLEPAEPRGSAASDPAFHAGLQSLDSGQPDLSAAFDVDALPQFAPEPSESVDGPSGETLGGELDDSVDWKTTLKSYSGVWIFCGSVGAAAAAVVFHAEVSRLVWQWSGAVRALWP
jgi:hypothetical protein